MSTARLIPVIAPTGEVADLAENSDEYNKAIAAGAKPGVDMIAPTGEKAVVPRGVDYVKALSQGAKAVPFQSNQTLNADQLGMQPQPVMDKILDNFKTGYAQTQPGMISAGAGMIQSFIQKHLAQRQQQNEAYAAHGLDAPNLPEANTAMGMVGDTAGMVSGATSPLSAAITAGAVLAPIPAAVGLVGYGGYQALKNSNALYNAATTGQANPQQVQEGLSGLATMAGGAALGKAGINELPSKANAGQDFQQVKAVVGDNPIDINAPSQDALRGMELAKSGGSMPKVMRDFIKRVNDPQQGPLTYSEARDFYSNATRLSADELNRLTPVMKSQVNQFTKSLGQSIGQTAEQGGVGQQYGSAMNEYAAASRWNKRGQYVADALKKTVPYVAAGYAVKKVVEGR